MKTIAETKHINGYKIELIETHKANPIAYRGRNGEYIDKSYGKEYDLIADGKFIGRIRNEIHTDWTKDRRKYGREKWIVYEEFMGDSIEETADKKLVQCIRKHLKYEEKLGHIGKCRYGYEHPEYDYENGGDMPDFGMYQNLRPFNGNESDIIE